MDSSTKLPPLVPSDKDGITTRRSRTKSFEREDHNNNNDNNDDDDRTDGSDDNLIVAEEGLHVIPPWIVVVSKVHTGIFCVEILYLYLWGDQCESKLCKIYMRCGGPLYFIFINFNY
jgi:hypothetical protein